jgi:hypothetical protein
MIIMKNFVLGTIIQNLSPYRYQVVTLIFEIHARDINIVLLSFLILYLLTESSENTFFIFHRDKRNY